MPSSDPSPDSERILLLPQSRRDGDIAKEVLADIGVSSEVCSDVVSLCEELARGAGAALLAEERLSDEVVARLRAVLAKQPAWSDFPLLIISPQRGGRSGVGRRPAARLEALSVSSLGNVTLLDAPLRMRTLVHAVRAAIRSRQRQYTAREAIEQRDRFLAMLGHELRNPLSVISMGVDLGILDPKRAAGQMPVLQRQVEHLTVLLDDLLDVARVSSGKIVLKKQPVALDELLQRMHRQLQQRFEDGRLSLRLRMSPKVVGHATVHGDPVRLEQVLNNLLINAQKYTLPGGQVELSLTVTEGVAEIRVTDTGVGISAEMLPVVFDLFTQAQTSLARSDGGMGVGLSLVQTLVQLHGGEVFAESEGLGHGSSFAIRLPVLVREDLVSTAVPNSVALRASARDILVVEDNNDSRQLLVFALEREGHRVLSAADGESGLALLLAERPHAAIVDIGLPGIDGYEVARQARTARGNDLLLIALTGYGQASDRRRALDAGFDVHLTKPPALEGLRELLARG
jgi:signal transduction histidine kinase